MTDFRTKIYPTVSVSQSEMENEPEKIFGSIKKIIENASAKTTE